MLHFVRKDRIWCVSYKRVKAGDNRSISKYVGFERVNESRSKLLKQGIRDKEDIMDKTARRVFEGLNYMLGGSKGMKWNEQLLVDVDSGRNIVCGCWAWNPKQVNWNRGSAFSCFYDVKDADRRRDYLSPYR